MSKNSIDYQIPFDSNYEAKKTSQVFELFEELNAISEEIERCRLKAQN